MTSTLVHISDLHFGNEDPDALEAARAYIAAHRPEAVIVSGDLTALGSERELKIAFAWLESLDAPVLATPGNHDTPYLELLPRLFYPFRGFYRLRGKVLTDDWSSESFAVTPINTARGVQFRKNWALGAISRKQTQRAGLAMQDGPLHALRVIVTHHPLIWPDNAPIRGDTRGGPAAQRRLMEDGATLFLSGHLHRSDVRAIEHAGRRAVLITASTLSIRHRGEPGGFIVIRNDGHNHIEVEQMYSANRRAVSGGVLSYSVGRLSENVV